MVISKKNDLNIKDISFEDWIIHEKKTVIKWKELFIIIKKINYL